MVLASGSPQRRAILAQVGIRFEVRRPDVEELTAGEPAAVAEENARRKARATASVLWASLSRPTASPPADASPAAASPSPLGDLVLGADTVVAIDGEILGKPRDPAQARAYLSRLAGRTHDVVGGVALASRERGMRSFVEVTRVRFRALGDELLDWYVGTGEWRSRAGGYAIQGAGAALVAGIEGDYLNVVGLPLARLLDEGFAAHLGA